MPHPPDKDSPDIRQMEKLIELIRSFLDEKRYGEIVIKIEAGKIVVVKKTESIKP